LALHCNSYTVQLAHIVTITYHMSDIVSDLSYPQMYKIIFYYNCQDTSKFGRGNQS